jgi:hypothetical protein
MNSLELSKTLLSNPHTAKNFGGVYASDRLPFNVHTRPCILIANTQDSFQSGAHWVAFMIFEHAGSPTVEYFNSLGESPTNPYFLNFIHRHGGLNNSSDRVLQNVTSDVCGQYVCVYSLFRGLDISLHTMLSLFTCNSILNDKLVVELFNTHFN